MLSRISGTTNLMKPINPSNMSYRLRSIIGKDSEEITDEELSELETKLPFGEYFDNEQYEFNGNFIITKNLVERELAVESMCCGIVVRDVELSNGETIYFAFDYGH